MWSCFGNLILMFFPYFHNFQHIAHMEMEQCTYTKYIYQISLDIFSQFVYITHPCTNFHCATSAFSNFMVINQIVHNAYQRSATLSLNNNPYSRSDFCALNSRRAFYFYVHSFCTCSRFYFWQWTKICVPFSRLSVHLC